LSTREVAGVVVFAPAPILTVTIERRGGEPDVHLHAGGQGFWVARMITALGVPVTLCASFGGETGAVIRTLIEREGVAVRGVEVDGGNVAYVHDRRGGARQAVAEMTPSPLSRHDLDELYGATLVAALDAEVCILGGPPGPDVVPADTYRRLACDLGANDKTVVADLAGEGLGAAVAGGVDVVKVSDEELVADGRAASVDETDLLKALSALRSSGVGTVVVSRASRPALAAWDGRMVEITTPQVEPLDAHGAGDSMTAGIAAALAGGERIEAALRLGAAAGSLNVARRGLATGRRQDIEEMARHVDLRAIAAGVTAGGDPRPAVTTVDELVARTGPA
jgi:1-phosphofructokinase